MGLERQRQPGVPLDVVGRVAGRRLDVDAHAVGAGVDGEAEAVLLAGRVDRVVLALAERRPGAGIGHDLDEVRVAGPAGDLAGGGGWVLGVDRDRALEHTVAVVLRQPGVGQPVVVRGRDRGAEIRVRVDVGERSRHQDRVRHAVFVDQLLPGEVRIGAGWTRARRDAVQPRAMDGVAKEPAPATAEPVAPRLFQVLADLVIADRVGMDIAVHQSDPPLGHGGRASPDLDRGHESPPRGARPDAGLRGPGEDRTTPARQTGLVARASRHDAPAATAENECRAEVAPALPDRCHGEP